MSRQLIRFSLVLLALAIAAPAVHAQQDSTRPAAAPRKPRGDRNKLTRADMEGTGTFSSALDVIRILRPQWLSPALGRVASAYPNGTGGESATQIVLYIDDMRQPDLESGLRTVRFEKIVEIRYLDQNRAIQMRGPGHEAGSIEVITTDKRK